MAWTLLHLLKIIHILEEEKQQILRQEQNLSIKCRRWYIILQFMLGTRSKICSELNLFIVSLLMESNSHEWLSCIYSNGWNKLPGDCVRLNSSFLEKWYKVVFCKIVKYRQVRLEWRAALLEKMYRLCWEAEWLFVFSFLHLSFFILRRSYPRSPKNCKEDLLAEI